MRTPRPFAVGASSLHPAHATGFVETIRLTNSASTARDCRPWNVNLMAQNTAPYSMPDGRVPGVFFLL